MPYSRVWNQPGKVANHARDRITLLILHTQAASGAYSQDSSRFPRRRHSPLFIYTVNRHRVSLEFIRSRNCVPMTFTAESPPTHDQKSSIFFVPLPFSPCMESTSYVLSFRMVFFYLVTTGWIFDISLCENSINQGSSSNGCCFFRFHRGPGTFNMPTS